jgi:hypothetical protein
MGDGACAPQHSVLLGYDPTLALDDGRPPKSVQAARLRLDQEGQPVALGRLELLGPFALGRSFVNLSSSAPHVPIGAHITLKRDYLWKKHETVPARCSSLPRC